MLQYRILPVTAFQQNCTLFWCDETRQAVVIDPGGEADRILATLFDVGVEPVAILLTHGHADHVSAAPELARRLGLSITGPHPDDGFLLQALGQQCELFGLPPANGFTPDRWLAHGERIPLGRTELTVIHCPGHTPGHLVFYEAKSQLAQVGDVLFRGAIGRTDFPGGNHSSLLASIRERLLPLGDGVRFIPGHGPISTFGVERRTNPFLVAPGA